MPFDILKIDRSFVAELCDSDESLAVVNAIIAVARSLNKEIVAEGIETLEQSALLARSRCLYGQGKLFAMPARQFAVFMRNWHKKKAS